MEAVPKSSSALGVLLAVIVILGNAQETGNSKKEEFANNLLQCVASQPIDLCLRNTLEDLRSLMPTGIPELNLRSSEPLQIDNIKFKTRPGLGVDIESEFSNVSCTLCLDLDGHVWGSGTGKSTCAQSL